MLQDYERGNMQENFALHKPIKIMEWLARTGLLRNSLPACSTSYEFWVSIFHENNVTTDGSDKKATRQVVIYGDADHATAVKKKISQDSFSQETLTTHFTTNSASNMWTIAQKKIANETKIKQTNGNFYGKYITKTNNF